MLEAARRGEARYAAALLAVAAGTPVSVVDRASSLRSAKGMVSLVWKAGFTMRAAVALQTLLARLAPDVVLTAGPGGELPAAGRGDALATGIPGSGLGGGAPLSGFRWLPASHGQW